MSFLNVLHAGYTEFYRENNQEPNALLLSPEEKHELIHASLDCAGFLCSPIPTKSFQFMGCTVIETLSDKARFARVGHALT